MEQITKHVEGQFNGQETARPFDVLPQRFESTLFSLFHGLSIRAHHTFVEVGKIF